MVNFKHLALSGRFAVAVACALATPAYAQSEEGDELITPGGVLPAGAASTYNPGDQLAVNLKLLAQNPRNVAALTQAGASALAAGDASAALGFLARADEISPSTPRIKQLLGSALVQLERSEDGLRLFSEAASLGGLNREILRDRGLAFDLRGDPRRAQADYAESLKRGPDDEVTRRYALSLGATGDREQALRLLDPLIRKQDQAAWRARAFVMAMTGDLRAAERIVAEVMPPNMAGTLGIFMRRLASLTPAQRAAAVNFGTMPADGPQYALVSQTEALRPISVQAAQNLSRVAILAPTVTAAVETAKREKPSKRDRRRPGRDRDTQLAVAQPAPNSAASVSRDSRPGFAVPSVPIPQAALPPKPATPSPSQPAPPDNRQGARVGQRVGAVDPALLPPQFRRPEAVTPGTSPAVAPPLRPATASPVQIAAVAPAPVPPAAETVVAATLEVKAPPPLFEIPSVKVDAPAARPVSVAGAVPVSVAVVTPAPIVQPTVQTVAQSVTPPPPAPVIAPPVVPSPAVTVGPSRVDAGIPSRLPASAPVQLANPPSLIPPNVTPLPATAIVREVSVTPPVEALPINPASPVQVEAVPASTVTVAAATTPPQPQAPRGLADVIGSIESEEESRAGDILDDAEFRRARQAAKRKADAEEAAALAKVKAKEELESAAAQKAKAKAAEEEEARQLAKRNPARIWVQVATGSNRAGLPGTWSRLKEKGGDALKGKSAASAPFKSTNRLLVGPYKTQAEARAAVNKLADKGVQATTFSSDAGEEVTPVGGR